MPGDAHVRRDEETKEVYMPRQRELKLIRSVEHLPIESGIEMDYQVNGILRTLAHKPGRITVSCESSAPGHVAEGRHIRNP
jgi:hypothetical protein